MTTLRQSEPCPPLPGRWNLLLIQAQCGQQAQLGILFREMEGWLRAMLLRTFGAEPARIDPREFDDVLQQTFLKVLENLARFEPQRGRASTWVWSICRNSALDFLRRRGRRRILSLEVLGENAPLTEPAAEPLDELIERENLDRQRDEVAHALAKLDAVLAEEPEAVGQAFRMRLAGQTYQQTAKALGVPAGTVATWIHRCRKKLR